MTFASIKQLVRGKRYVMELTRTMLAGLSETLVLVTYFNVVVNSAVLTADSAYSRVVVGLPEDIKVQDDQQRIILAVQELFTETSLVLHRSTGLRIGEVIFLIPPSWEKQTEWNIEDTEVLRDADVLVTSGDDSVFGTGPHALQFAGCGKAALRINLPAKFLLGEKPLEDISKGKLMAREWIKYRYGVFDENGFSNDTRFPLHYGVFGRNEIRITDCTNVPAQYTFRDFEGNNCSLQVDRETNTPNAKCFAIPIPDLNDEVTSSLMYRQPLSKVEFLCGDDGHPHNNLSPNKHNVLCNGRSVWDVLKQHADFKGRKIVLGTTEPQPPTYRFVKETKNRIVLAVDASVALAKFKDVIKNAVSNLIYSLPSGSEFGITTAKDTTLQSVPDDDDLTHLNTLVLKIDLIFRKPDSCPQCAIEKAMEILSSNGKGRSGSIILVSAGNPENLAPYFLENLKSSSICLTTVLFPNASSESYADIFSSVLCSRVFTISDDVSLTTLGQVYEAFESAIWKPASSKKITLKTAEVNPNSPVVFAVDETIASFDVWLSGQNSQIEIDEDDDVQLVPDTGPQPNVEKKFTVKSFVVLHVESQTAAKWTCNLNYESPLFMKIVAKYKAGNRLEANAWFGNTTKEGNEDQMPIILYASIFLGAHPVIDARVTAEIKTPDNEKILYSLLDNGLGDPDVTKNDGIYSRYFVNFTTAGEYEILLTIDDNDKRSQIAKPSTEVLSACCGSEVIIGQKEIAESFYREVKLHFTAKAGRPVNGYPPSTIRDLRLTISADNIYILKWTAPGGEKDYGKANKYILKQVHNYEDILNDMKQDTTRGFKWDREKIPQNYGDQEEMKLYITNDTLTNATYFLFLISFSKNGGKSEISNVIEVFVPHESDVTTSSDGIGTTNKIDSSPGSGSLDSTTIAYIVVPTVLIIVLVVCAYLAFFFYTKNKKKHPKADGTDQQRQEPQSNGKLNNNDGSVTAKEWKLETDPISPVNSVPAKVLLYHHEQVQDAKKHHKNPPLFKLENLRDNEEQGETPVMNGVKPSVDEEEAVDFTEQMPRSSEEYSESSISHNANHDYLEQPPKPSRRITNV